MRRGSGEALQQPASINCKQQSLPEIKLFLISTDTQGNFSFDHQSKTKKLLLSAIAHRPSLGIILPLTSSGREMLSQGPGRILRHSPDLPEPFPGVIYVYQMQNSFHKRILLSSKE